MSRKNKLGDIRRSQVLSYGPGAIIDFRAGGQGGGPVSVVAPGLEFWDEYAPPAFPQTKQKISEPRLQRKLGVRGFRLPPVTIDSNNSDQNKPQIALPGFRFPKWLQCPSCNKLKEYNKWAGELGDPSKWCAPCTSEKGRRIHVVPTRFVVACIKGHLDEFPWHFWLKRDEEKRSLCKGNKFCSFKLKSMGGTGLSSLNLVCDTEGCGISENMGDIFSSGALRGCKCSGNMPWLKRDKEDCGDDLRVLQRGASNLYLPIEVSALSIPPWSDAFQQALDVSWDDLAKIDEDKLPDYVELVLADMPVAFSMTIDDICHEIIRRKKFLDNPEREDLKYDEFCSFTGESLFKYMKLFDNRDFKTTKQSVPQEISKFISRSLRVDRLKEVRALKGFTRINPAASSFESGKSDFGKLASEADLKWLPAVEVRGEGIFFSLDDQLIDRWAEQPEILERARQVDIAHEKQWNSNVGADVERHLKITAKFLLLHTLSHIVMRHISLECGYDTASIRERVYCDEGERTNNGILLYTSSSDAEGTLGGLARMSEKDKFGSLILSAISKASWCSSDPLCIKGIASESESLNLAACHNCVLVPETSCESYNRFLDRALLVGSPDAKFKGFFEELLKN